MPSKFGRLSLAFLILAACAAAAPSARAEDSPRIVRWIVAHDRGRNEFTDFNERWARRIEKDSNGRLKIVFTESKAAESILEQTAYDDVASGRYDMSQLPAAAVHAHVLDMPFVFRNYNHAEGAFKSPVDGKMLAEVADASQGRVRAFAFTYSGGYRILAGRRPVRTTEDLKGARVRDLDRSPLTRLLAGLGAEPVKLKNASKDSPLEDVAAGRLDLDETEVNRLALVERAHPGLVKKLGYLNLTRHRMYVTAIVANDKFFASLPADLQKLLAADVRELAAEERKLSIDLELKNLKVLEAAGAKLVDFNASDWPAFVKAGEAARGADPATAALIAEIQGVKEPVNVTGK